MYFSLSDLLTLYDSLYVHPHFYKGPDFIPFLLLSPIPLYIWTTSFLSTPLSRHLSHFHVLALVNSAALGCTCLFEVCFSLVYDQSWDGWVRKRIHLRCSRCRRWGLNPWVGRSPEQMPGNPRQYSCLENPMARGSWQATVYMVTKSWTWLVVTEHTAHGSSMFNFLRFNMWFLGREKHAV